MKSGDEAFTIRIHYIAVSWSQTMYRHFGPSYSYSDRIIKCQSMGVTVYLHPYTLNARGSIPLVFLRLHTNMLVYDHVISGACTVSTLRVRMHLCVRSHRPAHSYSDRTSVKAWEWRFTYIPIFRLRGESILRMPLRLHTNTLAYDRVIYRACTVSKLITHTYTCMCTISLSPFCSAATSSSIASAILTLNTIIVIL